MCRLLASGYVIEEAKRNLETPAHLDRFESLLSQVEVVPEAPGELPCPLDLPDKDRPVFLAAVFARATHLITGDVKHFGGCFGRIVQGVEVLTPGAYLKKKGSADRGKSAKGREE